MPRGEQGKGRASRDGRVEDGACCRWGVKGEGALRAKLNQRVEDILVQRLARKPWSGWAASETLERQPDVMDNWRLRPRECKNAERLAIKRILDGAARAHFRGEEHIPLCPCGVRVDAQEHWLLRCHGVATEREERWEKVESEARWPPPPRRGRGGRCRSGGAAAVAAAEARRPPPPQ